MMSIILSTSWRYIIVTMISFIVYVLTMMPDIGFTDSGELAAVAHTLGIAHPTGYPLYTILAHAWSFISPYSTVYDLHLLAGICTALSVGTFMLILDQVLSLSNSDTKHDALISSSIALMFGFGSTVWSQGTSLEVYSLQLLLMMLIILFFLMAMQHDGISKYHLLWSLLIGLGFTNHGTTILLAPAMIVGYFSNWKGNTFSFTKERFTGIGYLIPWFLLGLLLWIYLPLRSAQSPLLNWGEVHRNWDAFSYHAFGKQYQVWMFNEGTAKENLPKFWAALISMTSWIILIPMALGLFTVIRKSKVMSSFLVLMIIGNLIYALNYGIHDIETYFLSGFIAMFICVAFGMQALIQSKPKLMYALPILIILNISMNYAENDKHDDRSVPTYISLMIDPLPKHAVIISSQWDYLCSGFLYKQIVEGYRPDIIMVEKELLRRTWYPSQLRKQYPFLEKVNGQCASFLEELQKFETDQPYSAETLQTRYINVIDAMIDSSIAHRRTVFITTEVLQNEPNIARGYAKVPQGLAFRIMPPPPSGMPELPLPLLNTDINPFIKSIQGRKGHLYEGLATLTANQYLNLAQYAWMTGRKKEAIQYLQISEKIDADNPTLFQLRQAITSSPSGPQ